MNDAIIDALMSQEPGRPVLSSLERLLRNDAHLLIVDANERSIACRLAMYMQSVLPDWHVDCEYNRDDVDPKKIRHLGLTPDDEDTEAKTAFPDLIAHLRGTQENYLVIEMKKTTNTVDRSVDFAKLRGYKRTLGFRFALFVELGTNGRATVENAIWV